MKRRAWYIRLAVVLLICISGARESYAGLTADSLEFSLLTCDPHSKIYSLYGHTAIKMYDKEKRMSFFINYGVFDFASKNFILRFVFGLTDYELGIFSERDFMAEYQSRGSGVTEQKLNLTSSEKLRIFRALMENNREENRFYRYNYFYDNCTTRARDLIVKNLDGAVVYPPSEREGMSYRDAVHEYNEEHPWARFGNDILLGVKADKRLTQAELQFLPFNLHDDFAGAEVVNIDGSRRRLVSDTRQLLAPGMQFIEDGFPLRPRSCALILLALTLVISGIELYSKKAVWAYDLLLMTASGLAGIVLTAMIFSQHPTVSLNLQILLLNPLPLLLAYPVIKRLRHHQSHWWWKVQMVLIALFFAGSLIQSYAEGMLILACSLLIRCLGYYKITPHIQLKKNNITKKI